MFPRTVIYSSIVVSTIGFAILGITAQSTEGKKLQMDHFKNIADLIYGTGVLFLVVYLVCFKHI